MTRRPSRCLDSGTQRLHLADFDGDGDQDLMQMVWTMMGAALQPWVNGSGE